MVRDKVWNRSGMRQSGIDNISRLLNTGHSFLEMQSAVEGRFAPNPYLRTACETAALQRKLGNALVDKFRVL